MQQEIDQLKEKRKFYYTEHREMVKTRWSTAKKVLTLPYEIMLWKRIWHKAKIEPDEWGFLLNGTNGDTYQFCSMISKAFLEENGGDKMAVVVRPKQAWIPRMFPHITRIVPVQKLPDSFVDMFMVGALPRSKGVLHSGMANVWCSGTKVSWIARMKAGYGLARDTTIAWPDRNRIPFKEQAARLLGEKGLKPGKTVLYTTVNSGDTSPYLNDEFWESLAVAFREKGWDVASNSFGRENVFKGTVPITFPYEWAIDLAEACGAVAGIRNGMFDVIATAKCRKTILYHEWNWKPVYLKEFNVQSLGMNDPRYAYTNGLEEFPVHNSNPKELIQRIVKNYRAPT